MKKSSVSSVYDNKEKKSSVSSVASLSQHNNSQMNSQGAGVVKKKSVLKKLDRSFETFKGGIPSSLNGSFYSVCSQQESSLRSYNANRLIRTDSQFEEESKGIKQKELVWTYESSWQRKDQKGGRIAISADNSQKPSLLATLSKLEATQKSRGPRIKRSEMTEEQKQLIAARKKNVQLMNYLRNIEDQIQSKFLNVRKLQKMNGEYESLYKKTKDIYTERVLLKNNFARQCEVFLEELKDVSISAQMNQIRSNTEQYEEEQKMIAKQIQIQTEEEEKAIKETIQLEEQLKQIKTEVESLSFEHATQMKKKKEYNEVYNEKLIGCLKQYRQVNILNEQISCFKKQFKTICYIANKKMKDNKVFNYEPYYTIKDKKGLEIFIPEKCSSFITDNSQLRSSQIKFSQMSSQIKSSTYKVNSLPKFTSIVNEDSHALFKDLNDKLSCEIELWIKGSLYGSIDSILSKLSFNSLEYDYVYNWNNPSQNNNDNHCLLMDEQESAITFNIFDSFVDIVKKRDISSSSQFSPIMPPNVILMMGDKNRGALACILDNLKQLQKFNNGFVKVRRETFNFYDLEVEKPEPDSLSFEDLIEKLEIELFDQLYTHSFCLECCLQVSQSEDNKQSEAQINTGRESYKKQIMIVVLNNQLQNKGQLARQIIGSLNKEKGAKDGLIEKLDPLIRNGQKRLLICELPNLIKCNDKSVAKFNIIKDILSFHTAIESNNPK